MSTRSTRRKFIGTAGVALSAPIAAAAATVPAVVRRSERGDDSVEARLARLEDIEAIRALNHAYAKHVNDGARDAVVALFADPSSAAIETGLLAVTTDHSGEPDAIDVAPDGATATARLHRRVEIESAIGPDCPLVDMARAQGGGVVRRTERGVFEHVYLREDGVWKIERATYRVV
jgi:SnoaL-like domain